MNKTGELKTPTRDQAAHYHLKIGCVGGSPSFVTANLFIPPIVDTDTQGIFTHVWYPIFTDYYS